MNNSEKQKRLIKYLLKVANINSKIVSSFDEYEKVFWLNDIPHERGCFSKTWLDENIKDKDEWAEIQIQREPIIPEVPLICKNWIDIDSLKDKFHTPKLLHKSTIRIEIKNEETGIESYKEIEEKLEDHPEIQKDWDNYLKNQWVSWVQNHNKWEKLQERYSDLYSIYQNLFKSGEEYELVLGIGLLTFKNEKKLFRRHLIVANAELELNPESGRLVLMANSNGCQLRIDSNVFENGLSRQVEEEINNIDDPFDLDNIEKCLKIILNSKFSDGEYKGQFGPIINSSNPIITLAPAIILRKRSIKGLVDTLKEMEQQIGDNTKVSGIFENLVESNFCEYSENNEDSHTAFSDGKIFFPKPCNKEQEEIAYKVNKANGILVQGPPGTGKSHTISNLICHLLANGQRILVTAKTSRALSVLRGLIPKHIQSLAISLLGVSTEEKQLLEQSVNNILNESNCWNREKKTRKQKQLEEELDSLKQKQAIENRRLKDIRESETIDQSVACGKYFGKAKEIAEKVRDKEKNYSWFNDTPSENKEFPFSSDELKLILHEIRKYKNKEGELATNFLEIYFSYDEFVGFVNASTNENVLNDSILKTELSKLSIDDLEDFLLKIHHLYEIEERFCLLPDKWIISEFNKVKVGNCISDSIPLKVDKIILKLENSIDIIDDYKVTLPNNYEIKRIYDDSNILKDFIKDGKSLSKLNLFMPKSVKDCLYIFEEVKINGKTCSKSNADLDVLTNVLHVRIEIEKAYRNLTTFVKYNEKLSLSLQIIELKKINDILKELIKAKEIFDECKKNIKSNCIDLLFSQSLSNIVSVCKILQKEKYIAECSKKLSIFEQKLVDFSRKENVHPVINKLLNAVRKRNSEEYKDGIMLLNSLNKERLEFNLFKNRIEKIEKTLPETIKSIKDSCDETYWEDRIEQIEDAWYWTQANEWITKYINKDKDDVPQIKSFLKQTEDKIGNIIAELAALHSWSFCISRLTANHKRHMEAWQLSVRKLGKGTGKHANRHRRDAQRHLAECREAIPVWIMPLHSVWNNVKAKPEIFDVVIIDEASQCGLEALPLFYLAKKILIVGDDKQISPANVGINRDEAIKWKKEYLYDIEDLEQFDTDTSLFDIGKIMFNKNKVVLREHFRCMPEIIKFSNELCYKNTPLIPMKQYGINRMQPLEHVFLENGYKEGKNQATNKSRS